MNKQRHHYPIGLLAQVLRVSRSGFYAWRQRPTSARRLADTAAKPLIREAHRRSRQTYGPRRLQTELAAGGLLLGRDRIGRLRKEMGLCCKQRRKFKATTHSAHSLPVEPNLLEQRFAAIGKPATVYGSDLTYVPTEEGWLYLAGVKDFATREIIGHAMGERMGQDLVHRALEKALRYRRPQPGCIHHFRPGQSVLRPLLPAGAEEGGDALLDVPEGQLLRQRPHRELLGCAQTGARLPPTVRHTGGGEGGDPGIHRGVLQPDASSFGPR